MWRFGRFTDSTEKVGYWVPLAGVSGTLASMETQIETLRVPNVHYAPTSANPHELVGGYVGERTVDKVFQGGRDVLSRLQALTTAVQTLTSIRSRVLAAAHDFAVSHYHALAFSALAQAIFEKHQLAVDELLRLVAPEVLGKIPTLAERLAAGDGEAISQAMNTLRRLIKALADRVRPAGPPDGEAYEIGSDKYIQRITAFLSERCPSETRRARLKRTLTDINTRASAAVHSDITSGEARALFLGTYLAIGEVLEFAKPSQSADTQAGISR